MLPFAFRPALILALALLVAACAPAAQTPTAAPAKPAEKAAAPAAEKPAAQPAAKAGSGDKIVMKIAFATVNDLQHEWAKRMKDRLEKRSNGQMEVQLFPASQLGNNQRMLEGVQAGTIEATIQPPEFMTGFEPRFQAATLPYLFQSMDELYKVMSTPEIAQTYANLGKDKGVLGVGTWPSGFSDIQGHFKIQTPDDLRGKKVRVLGSPVESATIAAFGGVGVPMPLDQVVTALQQRTVDAIMTAWAVVKPFKLADVVRYYNGTHAQFIQSSAVVSTKWLDTLPPDLQKAVVEESAALGPELLQWTKDFNAQAEQEWRASGQNEYVELTPEQLKVFQDRARPVWDQFLKEQPAAKPLVDMIEAEVKKVRGGGGGSSGSTY